MSVSSKDIGSAENRIIPESIGPTKILPHLYIGCMQDALNTETRKEYNIDHVLNVTITCPKPDDLPEEKFLRIPVNDGYIDNLSPYIDQACAFIDKVKSENGCVIVHCMAGISRSAAITIAYIMKTKMMPCEQAYRYVKSLRPIVSPNFNFLGQLMEYERLLNITVSPTSGAGSKRKRLDLGLPSTLTDPNSQTASPVHIKRLYVDNNNSITSLSPASALANLRFEHSLEESHTHHYSSLPPESSSSSAAINFLSVTQLNPPKRCHSWNGLAELGTTSESPTNPMVKRGLGLGSNRPRSLNLSMSNLSLPTAVVKLNAQVQRGLSGISHNRSSSDISQIREELESNMSEQEHVYAKPEIDQVQLGIKGNACSNFGKKEISLKAEDKCASQPALNTPAPAEISINVVGNNKFGCKYPYNIAPSKTNITPAYTAPSDLNKGIVAVQSHVRSRRRSRSLENLISPGYQTPTEVCMKCGRIDKRNVCLGLTHQLETEHTFNKTSSLHSSTEMIQVS